MFKYWWKAKNESDRANGSRLIFCCNSAHRLWVFADLFEESQHTIWNFNCVAFFVFFWGGLGNLSPTFTLFFPRLLSKPNMNRFDIKIDCQGGVTWFPQKRFSWLAYRSGDWSLHNNRQNASEIPGKTSLACSNRTGRCKRKREISWFWLVYHDICFNVSGVICERKIFTIFRKDYFQFSAHMAISKLNKHSCWRAISRFESAMYTK